MCEHKADVTRENKYLQERLDDSFSFLQTQKTRVTRERNIAN